jgi:hypothetical protein
MLLMATSLVTRLTTALLVFLILVLARLHLILAILRTLTGRIHICLGAAQILNV